MEPWFLINYYFTAMSWDQFMKFPVSYKRWLIERLNKEHEKAQKNGELTKGAHHQTPDSRELTGKQRPQVPPHLRKFT